MDFEMLEEIVNSFVVMGFFSIFGYIYCKRPPNFTSFKITPPIGFTEKFVDKEKQRFIELKGQLEEGLEVAKGIEDRFKDLDAFIKTGVYKKLEMSQTDEKNEEENTNLDASIGTGVHKKLERSQTDEKALEETKKALKELQS